MDGFGDSSDYTPLHYTASPLQLLRSEVKLIRDILLRYPASIPGVVRPFWSWDPEDELSLLNVRNVKSLILHAVLIVAQPLFLLSVVYALFFPVPASAYLSGLATFLILNKQFCKLLNGSSNSPPTSTTDLSSEPPHDMERWIFTNGVAVGRDWFQSNLNALSLTFRREIVGVHNITNGIIFDLLECLVQRDFSYATDDIRTGYAYVKKCLLDDSKDKIVLIVHSQGGIETGAILDWLLDDLPAQTLAKMEIYTFGSAANHFNNPARTAHPAPSEAHRHGVVRHIEHYTNSGDFVCRFGILGFIHPTKRQQQRRRRNHDLLKNANTNANTNSSSSHQTFNRFRGRLFKRNATGHMLNQHYLAYMFPRESYTLPDGTVSQRVADTNTFMDSPCSPWDSDADAENLGWRWPWQQQEQYPRAGKHWHSMVRQEDVDLAVDLGAGAGAGGGGERAGTVTPRALSRLWAYRNGRTPEEDEKEEEMLQEVEEEEDESSSEQDKAEENHVDEMPRTTTTTAITTTAAVVYNESRKMSMLN